MNVTRYQIKEIKPITEKDVESETKNNIKYEAIRYFMGGRTGLLRGKSNGIAKHSQQ
jgi:hypothetical protein